MYGGRRQVARARAGRPNASYATAVPVHARPSSGPRGSASEPGGPRCEEQWPSPSGDVPLEPVRAQYSGGADSSSIELSALTDWMGRANRPDILAGRRPPRGPFGVHWAFRGFELSSVSDAALSASRRRCSCFWVSRGRRAGRGGRPCRPDNPLPRPRLWRRSGRGSLAGYGGQAGNSRGSRCGWWDRR